TLFGSSINLALPGSSAAETSVLAERCEQCDRESHVELRGLDHVGCRVQSRLHSVLWEEGLPANTSNFLHHTLKVGCLWSQGATSRSLAPRIPKRFLLEYQASAHNDTALGFDLDHLRLSEDIVTFHRDN
ncbi:hypothetical protein HDU91_003093, partial [Kappamyces sp. JEL0680]